MPDDAGSLWDGEDIVTGVHVVSLWLVIVGAEEDGRVVSAGGGGGGIMDRLALGLEGRGVT